MPRMSNKPSVFGLLTWIVIGLMVTMFILLLLFVIGKTVPFKPLVVNSYEFAQSETCPGDLVVLLTERDVEDSYHVDSAHLESYWLLEGDSRPYMPYTFDLNDEELSDSEGAALRIAPFSKGKWYIHTEITVDGKVFGFVPRTSEVLLVTSKPLTIPPPESSSCSIDSSDNTTLTE
jgi:hypothetical protein